jgi:transcriptional regulator with XRE-family HTH domain
MPSIGQILRETRQKKGVSVSDVSHATRIKADYIERMESDQFDQLIAPAYARSFLRMYANYLGLDSVALLEQLRAWQPGKTQADFTPPSATRKPAMPSAPAPAPRRQPSQPFAQPTQAAEPPAPSGEMHRAPAATTARRPTAASSAPAAAASSPTPSAAAVRLKDEPPKITPSPLPAVAPAPLRSFRINAAIVVAIVATVSLTGILWLWRQRSKSAAADEQRLELKAPETVRTSPRRAADVLPLPAAP